MNTSITKSESIKDISTSITNIKQNQVTNKPHKLINIIKIICPILLLLTGQIIQRIFIPIWINSFNLDIGGPYFILCWSSLIFACFFGLLFLVIKIILYIRYHSINYKVKTVTFKKYWKIYIILGSVCGLNGIFVVYASPIDRIPPVLFCVLSNLGIFI